MYPAISLLHKTHNSLSDNFVLQYAPCNLPIVVCGKTYSRFFLLFAHEPGRKGFASYKKRYNFKHRWGHQTQGDGVKNRNDNVQ